VFQHPTRTGSIAVFLFLGVPTPNKQGIKRMSNLGNLKHFEFIPGHYAQARRAKRELIYAVAGTILLSIGLSVGVFIGHCI
jgi:hypothetical protein